MWLNSRGLSGDDDGNAPRDGVWGFSSPNVPPSGANALWNRMEPAEEEREEEALPSYLSYLQPAFRPAPSTPSTMGTSHSSSSQSFYTAKRAAPGLAPPVPVREDVGQVARKSSELAQALEHLVLGSVQRHLEVGEVKTKCRSCDAVRLQVNEMAMQMQALQNQVLELTKNSIPTAVEVGRVNVKSAGNWSANAAPFVPKQYKQPSAPATPQNQSVDASTATVLSDRISTLEGRQSAFQSQLAQIAKVLNIPTGKPGKHSPVKHLVQTLRDEVDAKVQQARDELTAEITAALGDAVVVKTEGKNLKSAKEALSSDAVLAALASEHEASLARLSNSFEELMAEEARQRAALEARVRSQLAQQEEWLQQLEGAFGSPHDPEHDQESHDGDSDAKHNLSAKLAELERKYEESRELYRRLSRLLPHSGLRQTPFQPDEEEEEDGLGWPGHMIGRG